MFHMQFSTAESVVIAAALGVATAVGAVAGAGRKVGRGFKAIGLAVKKAAKKCTS